MTDLIHNSTNGRHAEFIYIGNGVFTFKVLDAAGNIIASGSGGEGEVEARVNNWVHGDKVA